MRQPGPVPDGVNREYDRRALAAVFPGRPVLASFALRTRQEKDIGSAVQNIAALAAAGYQVDAAQVTAETGYEVALKDASTPAQPPLFAPNSKPRALDKKRQPGPVPDGVARISSQFAFTSIQVFLKS